MSQKKNAAPKLEMFTIILFLFIKVCVNLHFLMLNPLYEYLSQNKYRTNIRMSNIGVIKCIIHEEHIISE